MQRIFVIVRDYKYEDAREILTATTDKEKAYRLAEMLEAEVEEYVDGEFDAFLEGFVPYSVQIKNDGDIYQITRMDTVTGDLNKIRNIGGCVSYTFYCLARSVGHAEELARAAWTDFRAEEQKKDTIRDEIAASVEAWHAFEATEDERIP